MTTIKQVIVIGNSNYVASQTEIVTDRADNISGSFDMDDLSGTLSFTLPYIDKRNEEFNEGSIEIQFKSIIKKWTFIRLFAQTFDTNEDSAIDLYNEGKLVQVFEGVVETAIPSRAKTDYNYSINCIGTLSFVANEFKPIFGKELSGVPGTEYFDFTIQQSGTANFIDLTKVERNLSEEAGKLIVRWANSNDLKEIYASVKDDFGVRIHQQGNGIVNIFDPLYYFTIDQVPAWEFVLGYNMFNIDYGDITGDVSMVECVGYGDIGYAIDPTGIALKGGTLDISTDDEHIYNKITIFRLNITSLDELELEAKNVLLELMRNNVITFQTIFKPEINVGDFITVQDGEIYSDQAMQIKSFTFDISKGATHMTITAWRSVLATQPEALIVSKTGITDLDILEIRDKVTDIANWNSFSTT